MGEGRPRRQSRGKQRKSYTYDEVYSFLDDDEGSRASEASDQDEQSEKQEKEDADDFKPDEEEQEDDEDEDEDMIDEEEENVVMMEDDVARGDSVVELYSDEAGSATSTPRRQSKGRQRGTRMSAVRTMPGTNVKTPAAFVKSTGLKVHPTGIDKMRSRGVVEFGKGGQEMRLKDLFGPSHNDLKPVLLTRDRWKFQETLPSRKQGSLQRSFYVPPEAREKELKTMKRWYEGIGRESFAAAQKSKELTAEEGEPYMVNLGADSINLLMGKHRQQKVYTLSKGSYMSTAEPFDKKEGRRGWILHLGSRVQEAQWATNEEGSTQYLAIAVQQKQTPGRLHKDLENPKAPAFTATKPFPASIQIWAFDSAENGELNPQQAPRHELVICTDWGAPKHFRWCPIGNEDSVEPSEGANTIHLGLLAGIWSDGRLRILDVSFQKPHLDSPKTQYLHYSNAAFEVSFPNTIPTCLHWLSGTSLAVATAAGTLAIWTLTRPGMFPPLQSSPIHDHNPQPWFYRQVSDTYILSLSSGWPSRPHYISITTADGLARLFDLRSSNADATASMRGRMLCTTQAWHEHTQSFIMPDEHYMLKNNTLRRFYHSLYSMRVESSIVACATSPVQPGVLIGGADGAVVAGNPIARVLNSKEMPWQQPWFVHEYRQAVNESPSKVPGTNVDSEENAEAEGADASAQDANGEDVLPATTSEDTQTTTGGLLGPSNSVPNDLRTVLSKPLARITEGYKAHQPGLQYPNSFKRYLDGAKLITIYEEKSAITTLAWNPNLKFGTWAVAGMADGLLRIEDLDV